MSAAPKPRLRNKPMILIASKPMASKPKSAGAKSLAKIILVKNSRIRTIMVDRVAHAMPWTAFFYEGHWIRS